MPTESDIGALKTRRTGRPIRPLFRPSPFAATVSPVNGVQKAATAACLLCLAGLVALAAPTVAAAVGEVSTWGVSRAQAQPTSTASATPTETPSSAPTGASTPVPGPPAGYVELGHGLAVPAGGPGNCRTTSWIDVRREGDQPWHATLLGPDLVDTGAAEFATGSVGRDARGRIKTYTVAPGDVASAIGDRFCLGNGISLPAINHTSVIHPGDVLILTPDPSLAWIPYDVPTDAPAGFLQAPYRNAMEAMGEAARAGDVEGMRQIWADRLKPMTSNAADIAAITQALQGGDLDVLREMFG